MIFNKWKYLLLITPLIFPPACSESKQTSDKTATKTVSRTQVAADAVTVSAFLVYDDGSESKTDLLNSKNVVLYNTVSGGGTAKKPAHSVKIVINGNLKGLHAKFEEYGKEPFIEKFADNSKGEEIILEDIGCKTIHFTVQDEATVIYENMLPFGCGE